MASTGRLFPKLKVDAMLEPSAIVSLIELEYEVSVI